MLNNEIDKIIQSYKKLGWILEPEAKRLFNIAGLRVPDYKWAKTQDEALEFADQIKYPVVAKVISSQVIHKSDVGGVIVGISNDQGIKKAYQEFSKLKGFKGILIEEMINGLELIIGGKIDYQFGPVILMGLGGTGVEIYRDIAMRMAPLDKNDVISMVNSLKGQRIISGFRGSNPVNLDDLTDMLLKFSSLLMQLENYIDSIDLNPVICSKDRCVIADARIILNS